LSELAGKEETAFCRECGKPIETGARFCRFCGKSQADPASAVAPGAAAPSTRRSRAATTGLEDRLQQLFPRHPLQDEFMHIGTIAAFFMALIGFVLGFFTPALGGNWLSTNFLLGSVALLLFLILRESTLSLIRVRNGGSPAQPGSARTQAGRVSMSDAPAEAATADSSPPSAAKDRPPVTPR
jgi:hypothetical protein